ncbi:MAG TPA: low molecular weight protein-tyrosine-phosphatase [Chitinophagales bacterium]|nr:low molecular weight protein-tyrosine-phosphatase [Chitinophagales bacterium]
MRILFVCLGNICRSPLAEGILKAKLQKHGLSWEVDSAGTGAWHVGESPDERAVAIARKYGIDITCQRARQFSPYDFERFDRIYTMDTSVYDDVRRLALSDEEMRKVTLILNEVYPDEFKDVPDPYWNDEGFEEIFRLLDGACEAIVKKYANVRLPD